MIGFTFLLMSEQLKITPWQRDIISKLSNIYKHIWNNDNFVGNLYGKVKKSDALCLLRLHPTNFV